MDALGFADVFGRRETILFRVSSSIRREAHIYPTRSLDFIAMLHVLFVIVVKEINLVRTPIPL